MFEWLVEFTQAKEQTSMRVPSAKRPVSRKLAASLVVLAFVLGVLFSEWSHTIPGTPFGCTYDPLPFGLSHWTWLEYQVEVRCGA